MATLRDVIDAALQERLPDCPAELRERIVDVATPVARKAIKAAVADVLDDADMDFAYQEVERYRAEREARRAAREALRTKAAELRDLLDDAADEYGAVALADRIAELGPKTAAPTPIRLAPPTDQPA